MSTTKPPKSSPTHTKTGHPIIRHRQADGQFKSPTAPPTPKRPSKPSSPPALTKKPLQPAELDQDSGQGYNPNRENIQQ